jgi:hypothetical protein
MTLAFCILQAPDAPVILFCTGRAEERQELRRPLYRKSFFRVTM